jgi:hypothetical protein
MMMMSRGLPGRQAQPAAKSCPVEACRTWVDSMVIGLSLCPWAKPVRDSGGLRYTVTHAREAEGLSAALLHEIDLLQSDPEIETTLLVHPHVFADDFLAFTQYTQNTEAWMQDEGLVDDFQLVGFHPAHQFMNEEEGDAGNVHRHGSTHSHPKPPTAAHSHPQPLSPIWLADPRATLRRCPVCEPVAVPDDPPAAAGERDRRGGRAPQLCRDRTSQRQAAARPRDGAAGGDGRGVHARHGRHLR